MGRRLLWIMMVGAHAEGAAGNPDHVRAVGVRRRFDLPELPVQHRDMPSRAASLLAVVPESLGAGRVGVIPTHAGCRSRTGPGRRCCRRHEADRRAGCDGAAPWPAVRAGTRPGASSRGNRGASNGNIAARADHCRAPIGCTAAWANRNAAAVGHATARTNRDSATAGNRADLDAISERLVTGLDAERSRRCNVQGVHRRHCHDRVKAAMRTIVPIVGKK